MDIKIYHENQKNNQKSKIKLKVKEIAKIANTIDYALVRVYNNIKVKESQKQITGGFYGI